MTSTSTRRPATRQDPVEYGPQDGTRNGADQDAERVMVQQQANTRSYRNPEDQTVVVLVAVPHDLLLECIDQ